MDIKMIITHTQNTCKTDTLSFTVNVQTYTTFWAQKINLLVNCMCLSVSVCV